MEIDQHDAEGVRTLVFTTTSPGNAVGLGDLATLLDALAGAARDDGVDAVVLAGPDRAFCAGATEGLLADLATERGRARLAAHVVPHMRERQDLPALIVTAVTGSAIGVGLNLALAGDVRVMSRRARLLPGFARLGLPPEYDLPWDLVVSAGTALATEILLSPRPLGADRCLALGLVNEICEPSAVVPTAQMLARSLVKGIPSRQMHETLRLTRRAAEVGRDRSFDACVAAMFASLATRIPQQTLVPEG